MTMPQESLLQASEALLSQVCVSFRVGFEAVRACCVSSPSRLEGHLGHLVAPVGLQWPSWSITYANRLRNKGPGGMVVGARVIGT